MESSSEQEVEIRERVIRMEESIERQIALTREKGYKMLISQLDKSFNHKFIFFTTMLVLIGVIITSFQIFA